MSRKFQIKPSVSKKRTVREVVACATEMSIVLSLENRELWLPVWQREVEVVVVRRLLGTVGENENCLVLLQDESLVLQRLSFWFASFVVILAVVWRFHFSRNVHYEGVVVGVKVHLLWEFWWKRKFPWSFKGFIFYWGM